MNITALLNKEVEGSLDFFLDYTNLNPDSKGYGLTVDTTKNKKEASIASVGFALTAWVIAVERGRLSRQAALEITRKTLHTLFYNVSHWNGFFAHFLNIETGERRRKCEFSTIDTSICLNGVITAAAYFQDEEVDHLAQKLLERVDWDCFIFERNGSTLFRMAYNLDDRGVLSLDHPGFIHQWNMAAEQKMMYLQAAGYIDPALAVRLYQGFSRDTGLFEGQKIIVNPGGNLFAYQFSEAWLDTRNYLDPDGIDWFNNTRLAALANRSFCIEHSDQFKTYHANSWGASCGDSPWGYDVSGSTPALHTPKPNGTVSIFSALACLPFIPDLTMDMVQYLHETHPKTWGKYGFYDSYNLDVTPPWYARSLYGIDKGCSMIMIENYLTGLVWETYTNSQTIQKALAVLGFTRKPCDEGDEQSGYSLFNQQLTDVV